MKAFTALYTALDETNKTNEKVQAMVNYFAAAPPADAAWAIYFLIGRKPKQLVQAPKLRAWTIEIAGISEWLFDESYHAVGDLAEAMALLVDGVRADAQTAADRSSDVDPGTDRPLHEWVEQFLLSLRDMDDAGRREVVLQAWREMDSRERFVWNKLITSEFRVGVSHKLVVRALAEVTKVDEATVAHRLMGNWEPVPAFYRQLMVPDTQDADVSRPYPFFLAYPIEGRLMADVVAESDASAEDVEEAEASGSALSAFSAAELAGALKERLGDVHEWQAEWKWDGIRSQVIRRQGQTFVWSRGEELVTERFPEIAAIGDALPDGTVIDGEIMPYREGHVLPFAELQKRIGRKALSKKILSDVPVVLITYDLLEDRGKDVRTRELRWRRARLAQLVAQMPADSHLLLSEVVPADSWERLVAAQRDSRNYNAEGLMLKHLDSAYGVGRQVGGWWKWKVAPYTVDAVLIYAQLGNGRRASLYTDYTFGVWDNGKLLPFAKAYSGLTDEEIRRVDAYVRQNTLEKFGPVRTVRPKLVFELAFEGIQRSTRHKSGIAVRFPRILRWRHDKPIEEADSLDTIQAMLPPG
jgi:DNA ligase-1